MSKAVLIDPVVVPRAGTLLATVRGQRITSVLPCLLSYRMEPFAQATLVGSCDLTLTSGEIVHALLFQRQRPFVPFGADPKVVNNECSRLFAIVAHERGPDNECFDVIEVTP